MTTQQKQDLLNAVLRMASRSKDMLWMCEYGAILSLAREVGAVEHAIEQLAKKTQLNQG